MGSSLVGFMVDQGIRGQPMYQKNLDSEYETTISSVNHRASSSMRITCSYEAGKKIVLICSIVRAENPSNGSEKVPMEHMAGMRRMKLLFQHHFLALRSVRSMVWSTAISTRTDSISSATIAIPSSHSMTIRVANISDDSLTVMDISLRNLSRMPMGIWYTQIIMRGASSSLIEISRLSRRCNSEREVIIFELEILHSIV